MLYDRLDHSLARGAPRQAREQSQQLGHFVAFDEETTGKEVLGHGPIDMRVVFF
jgi:hypothetical protein